MMTRMLKTAEPTMVPTPTSPLVMNTPEMEREVWEGL
jgi:N-acyl-L-homoserine lactone synthetase